MHLELHDWKYTPTVAAVESDTILEIISIPLDAILIYIS